MIVSRNRSTTSEGLPWTVWLVLALGTVARIALLFLSRDGLVTYRLPDDALYYFAIAKHFVRGEGISFDGVHLTNGFHPLWLLTILPLFALKLSLWNSIYAVLVLQTLLDALVAWLIARFLLRFAAANSWAILIACAAYALNPTIALRGIDGLETTVASLVCVLWLFSFHSVFQAPATRKQFAMFGLLSGLLFLARTDFAVILLVSGLFLVLLRWRSLRAQWLDLALSVLIAMVIVSPWLIWNLRSFGSIVQVSAEAVPFMAQRKYDLLYGHSGKIFFLLKEAARNILKPFAYIAIGLPLIVIIGQLFGREQRRAFLQTMRASGLLLPLGGALLLLAFHSIVRGLIRDWYIVQLLSLIAVVFGVACTTLAECRLRPLGVLLVLLMLITGFYEWQHPRYESQRAIVFAGVPFVQGLASGERVGAFNSGWYGYFAGDGVRIADLDGVVNPEVFPYIKSGKIHEYLERDSINAILDFPADIAGYRGLIDPHLTDGYRFERSLRAANSVDSLELLRRIAVFTTSEH